VYKAYCMISIDKKLCKVTSFVLYRFFFSYYYYIVLLSCILFLVFLQESFLLFLFLKVILLPHIYFGLNHIVEDYVLDKTLVIFLKSLIFVISYIYFVTFILYEIFHIF